VPRTALIVYIHLIHAQNVTYHVYTQTQRLSHGFRRAQYRHRFGKSRCNNFSTLRVIRTLSNLTPSFQNVVSTPRQSVLLSKCIFKIPTDYLHLKSLHPLISQKKKRKLSLFGERSTRSKLA